MKKFVLSLSLLLVFTLVGCGSETTTEQSTETTTSSFDATATIKAYTRDTTSMIRSKLTLS